MARRTRTFLSAGAALLLLFGAQGRGQQPRAQRRRRPPGRRRQPISRPSRRRQSAAAADPPTADAAVPDRHQLRSRRCHRVGPERHTGRRLEAKRLRGRRGRQAADGGDIQADQAGWRHRADIGHAGAADPHRRRRAGRGGERRRPAVRDFPGRLPRPARGEHDGGQSALTVRRHAARAVGHDRRDAPAGFGRLRPDDPQSLDHHHGRSSSFAAASSTTSRRTTSSSAMRTTPPKRWSRFGIRSRSAP